MYFNPDSYHRLDVQLLPSVSASFHKQKRHLFFFFQKMSGSVWEVVSKNNSDNCFLLVGGFASILERSKRMKEWIGCSQGKA